MRMCGPARDMVVKVKEPLPEEYPFFRDGLILFTYLHLAPVPELTKALLDSGVIGIAYETVQLPDGSLPLLVPMSEVAGRAAVTVGSYHLGTRLRRPGPPHRRSTGSGPCGGADHRRRGGRTRTRPRWLRAPVRESRSSTCRRSA